VRVVRCLERHRERQGGAVTGLAASGGGDEWAAHSRPGHPAEGHSPRVAATAGDRVVVGGGQEPEADIDWGATTMRRRLPALPAHLRRPPSTVSTDPATSSAGMASNDTPAQSKNAAPVAPEVALRQELVRLSQFKARAGAWRQE
jgi:hypothetical protein